MGDEQSRAERDAQDARAIRRICDGNGEDTAIAELYDHYAPSALGLALRIVRDQRDAEDVVHDAFIAVVERADQYRPERGTVAAWLITTVRNLALDRMRRRVRRAQIADEELRNEPVEPPPDPAALFEVRSEQASVAAALARLPETQRRTIEVAFFEGLSYPEIAARDGVPLGTVKSRAARALAALRDFLENPGAPARPPEPDPDDPSGRRTPP